MHTHRTALGGALVLLLALAVTGPAAADPRDPAYPKAFACSACHGADGASRADTVPVLAGMPAWYLKKAIQDYASGRRPAAEMEPYAKQVMELGVDDVAGYFAKQTRQPSPVKLDAAAVERGRTASRPCVVCHGEAGKGDPAKGIPDLTAQPPGYLVRQMQLFKADTRSPGDANLRALKALMKTLPDEQFADLAAYYSSLGR